MKTNREQEQYCEVNAKEGRERDAEKNKLRSLMKI